MPDDETIHCVAAPVAIEDGDADDAGAHLKGRLLLPLAVVFAFLAAAFAYSTYQSERALVVATTEQELVATNSAFSKTMEFRGNRLLRGLEFLDRDPLLRKTLAAGDRERIQAAFGDMFERLRRQFGISHFYFIRPDRTVLLRLHQPEVFNDRIDRHTLMEAERTGRSSAGLEIGAIGTLSLRAVKPVFAGTHLLGYVELSEEVQYAMQEPVAPAGSESIIVLHKKWLAQSDWEAGMRMLGRRPDWDQLPTSVVAYSTLPQMPPMLEHMFPEANHRHLKSAGEIRMGERIFEAGFIPIFDVAGSEVGDLVILRDTTAIAAYLQHNLQTMIAVSLVLVALLIWAFWAILARVQASLASSRRGLIAHLMRRKLDEAEIEQLAYYDHLTRLPNRRLLIERIRRAFVSSARDHHHGAVLLIDLDHFNLLNDTRGHEIGDQLLLQVAPRLQSCVRACDTVARLGGDEFVALLEGLSSERTVAATQVETLCEQLRATLAEPIVIDTDIGSYHCTASIGAELFLGHENSVDELLKHADAAMYQAKAAGRDTMYFFDPAMQATLEFRAALETDLRHALAAEQFALYYQPQIDKDGRTLSAEALLRWIHPGRGLVRPADFIPLAEETGLIVPIGNWVLEKACTEIRRWQDSATANELQLAVNVSARQFRQPDFIGQVQSILERTGAEPSRLKLELTESVILNDVDDVVAKMNALKALGIRLSLDDFGTGYSSLSYLKKLPLDQIKIDQSFVRDIVSDPNDAVMVKTIINLAQSFGMNVIAEGVETEAQLDFLKANGCREFQGYFFSKPVPIDQFEVLLK